jgi:hypothetical protein
VAVEIPARCRFAGARGDLDDPGSFDGWGYRSRWFDRIRPLRQRKQTAAMNAEDVERDA